MRCSATRCSATSSGCRRCSPAWPAHCIIGVNLAARGQTPSGDGVLVSGSYFPTLGLQPALGRLLTPDDDRTPGAHAGGRAQPRLLVVALRREPGRRSNEPLIVNGKSMTVVGVAPRGFEGTTLGSRPTCSCRCRCARLLTPGWKGLDNRRSYWAYVFARLKPGRVDRAGARGDGRAVSRHHHRRRGAAADGHERSDDAALPDQAAVARSRARAARARCASRRGRRCCCCWA